MLETKGKNLNYLAKVVEVEQIRKHEGADRLQIVTIDFQNVIVDLKTKKGDKYIFFPLESQIDPELLKFINAYSEPTLNADPSKKGFFSSKGRVKASRLRGEKSMGFLVNIELFTACYKLNPKDLEVGKEFDTVNNKLIVTKYCVGPATKEASVKTKQSSKVKRESILVEGQVRLHTDTSNLRKSSHMVSPESDITITYKEHGTSFWCSNVMVKRDLSTKDKIAKFFGVMVQETEPGLVYGSRKVIKNEFKTSEPNHFYKEDIWKTVAQELQPYIPVGWTIYGEIVGFLKSGGYIQKGFDYGLEEGQHEAHIYRITQTSVTGQVTELSFSQIAEFCKAVGLKTVPLFYKGRASDLFPEISTEDTQEWRQNFIKKLEEVYNEKDCYMCKNTVPEEGIVLRTDALSSYNAYKLKSFRFLEYESSDLDRGEVNIEE